MLNKVSRLINKDIHLKEILTGSVVTFILKITGMLLGYIVILIISKKYGAEGVGVYSLVLSLMTFFAMISTLGMNISILRFVGQFNRENERYKLKLVYRYALQFVLPLSIFFGIFLYMLADFLSENIFHNSEYKPALKFIAFILPFLTLLNISVEFIRGLKELKISEFLRSVGRPIVNILLLSTAGLYIVNKIFPVYTLGVGIVISSMFSYFFIQRKIKYLKKNKKNDNIFSQKEFFITSFPMMISAVASFMMGNISLVMLEIFSSTKDVGIYSVVFKLATLISLVLVVVNTISAPKFSELYWQEKYDELQKIITQSTLLIFFSSVIIALILIVFRKSILALFGDEFIVGSYPLIVLIIAQLINSVTGSVSILLNMSGNQKVLRNILLVTTVLSIVSSYFLVVNYGVDGAAYSVVFNMALLNIVAAIYVKQKLGFVTYFSPFALKYKKRS